MLRTYNAILGLVPALALGFLSCTTDPATGKEESIADDEAALVAADRAGELYGTYRALVVSPGGMPLLVLETDGTYHRAITLLCPMEAWCVPAQDDGHFSVRRLRDADYMFLYSDTGGVARYQYVLKGDKLLLRPQDRTAFMTLTKTPEAAWCEETYDCLHQDLDAPSCRGVWYCGMNLCNYACTVTPVREPRPVIDPDPTEPLTPAF